MEAKDIRIGNLVKIDGMLRNELFNTNEVITDTDEFKVATIDTMFVNLWINGVEYEFDIKDLQPIPLTTEWLLKVGFNNLGGLMLDNKTPHKTFEKSGLEVCLITHTFTYNNSMLCELIAEHVHQLQNIYFAIIGTELESK